MRIYIDGAGQFSPAEFPTLAVLALVLSLIIPASGELPKAASDKRSDVN